MNKTGSAQATQSGWTLLFVTWVVVTIATLGSLFLSEVMDIPVCELCWYQRITMYPLVVILAFGLFPFDPGVVRIAATLVALGWSISLFHVLVVAGIIPETMQPCVQGIPCSETHLSLLGFLNIPLLSFLNFSLIAILLFYTHRMRPS